MYVDRNYILQALGEAIRVAKEYILVSGFTPVQPFRTNYKYKSGLFTYHIDHSRILESTGIFELVYDEYGVDDTKHCISVSVEDDRHEWNRVRTSIFRKNQDLLPIKSQEVIA